MSIIEARAVVSDEECGLPRVLGQTNLDLRVHGHRGELPSERRVNRASAFAIAARSRLGDFTMTAIGLLGWGRCACTTSPTNPNHVEPSLRVGKGKSSIVLTFLVLCASVAKGLIGCVFGTVAFRRVRSRRFCQPRAGGQ